MPTRNSVARIARAFAFCALILLVMLSVAPRCAFAQGPDDFKAERQRVIQLINEGKFAEALPVLEKLAASSQADGQVFYGLGIAVLMTSREIKEEEARTRARLRARTALLRAKEMGVSDPNLEAMIKSITPDGGEAGVSKNKEAQAAMQEAFKAFAARDYEKAARDYERAARLDPTLYEAALYTGNSHYALKNWDKAGEWFARAIALDADREIAYRYWGDAFMLSGKQEAARDKFFDAIIAEPYSQLAWKGLIQWAERNSVSLSHPKIVIPIKVSTNARGEITVNVDESAIAGKTDGSAAWMGYGLTRATWATDKTGKLSEKFSKAYPNEKAYRHSLAEEIDALRMIVTTAKEQMKGKDFKQLEPSLAALVKLHDAGLLEAYVLLARADQGIARDYAAYRQANRDKLRSYLLNYVITGSGK